MLLLLLRLLRVSALPARDALGHAWTRTVDRKLRWLWSVPGPDRHIARAPEAVQWAWAQTHAGANVRQNAR